MVEGAGCEMWGVGCGVWGVGCGVWSAGISEESGDVATQLETAPPGFKPLLRCRL